MLATASVSSRIVPRRRVPAQARSPPRLATAGRLESAGVPGRVQVSRTAFEWLRDTHTFEERGEVELKGKGRLRTYLLVGPSASYPSVAPEG